MTTRISVTRATLLACATLACGPKAAETDADTSTATITTGTSTTSPTSTGVTTGQAVDPCALEPDPGGCNAGFLKWAFDPTTRRCYEWYYGGCDGVVPFDDPATCQDQCEPCEAFAGDVKPAPTRPESLFTVRNDSAQAIYLRTYTPSSDALGFHEQAFAVRPENASEALVTVPNACDFSCASFANPGCGNGCGDGGPPPPPIVIQPGGVFTASWDWLHFAQGELPERCRPAACEPGLQCGRWLEAWTGSHEVTAVVATSWSCAPDCTCTPNTDGWCQLPAGEFTEPVDPQELTASSFFPGDPAELVFQ